MTRAGVGRRSLCVAAVMLVGAAIAGCGDGTSNASTANAPSTVRAPSRTTPVFPITRPPTSATPGPSIPGPTIAGLPVTTVVAGQPYSFQPQVANTGSAAVNFSIAQLPVWAKFNATTGQLTGTPTATQVGQYAGIIITLIEGTMSVALPAFSITVAAASSDTAVTLSWQAPTENADGTPLVDLQGYNVHYGSASKTYSDIIQVANPGLTTYVLQNLAAGEYYFAITAYNSTGAESSLSPEVSTMVN